MHKASHIGGDIGHDGGRVVILLRLLAFLRYLRRGLPHDEAARGEKEEQEEDEELGVECSLDKTVPFDLQ